MFIFIIYGIIKLGDTMDNKLYDSINSNSNLNDSQKIKINNYLQTIKYFYSLYGVEYDFENISNILNTLRIVDGTETEEISYNRENNIIILGKSPSNVEFNSIKCLLELCSQRYDLDEQKLNNGLIIEKDNKEYGKQLNESLIKFLTTLITGLSTEADDKLTDEDINKDRRFDVLHKIQELVGVKTVVESFANAKGEFLFNELSKYIDKEQLLRLYQLLDLNESKENKNIPEDDVTPKM